MTKHILALIIGLSISATISAQSPDSNLTETSFKPENLLSNKSMYCEYCGDYQLSDNPYLDAVNVHLINGKLMASAANYTDLVLEPSDKDVYYISNYHAKVVFTRKESIVTGVKISALALKFTGEKL
ncbi:MAG TPA: hypothetical protein VK590_10660 [Saprospiraceae bacterium]|nr:hypothetical protein [Saprospiraceae bacterium]